jgi:hypothetical protein
VCGWNDEGLGAWAYSDLNGQTLVEAQHEFLSGRGSRRGRRPERHEQRDPAWRPYELTDEMLALARQTREQAERDSEEERRRVAQEIADDPEGPFQEYNAELRALAAEAPQLPHAEVKARLQALGRMYGVTLPDAYLELQSRLLADDSFYRRRPLHAAWWLLRYARPGSVRRHWRELRTRSFTIAG